MKINSDRGFLGLLLLFALAIRVIWALLQPSTDAAIDRLPDQREYLSLGRNLLHERTLYFFDSRFDQSVFAYRTPGYPAFIAMCGAVPGVIRVAQAFVDTSTVLAIYLLAWRLSKNERLARWSAALVAVNPFLIYFCGLVLSETLFTSLLVWGMLLVVRRRIIAGGIYFLAAVLVRPSAIVLGPLIAGMVALLNPTQGTAYSWWKALRYAATVICIIFIGLLPWAVRNHRVIGSWIWTTTNTGVTLYDGFNPSATGNSNQQFLSQMPELTSINEVERSVYLKRAAGQWIASHPDEVAGLTLRKIGRTWTPIPLSAEFGRPIYRWISALYAVPFDVLVVIGICVGPLQRRVKIMLIIPAIYFTVVHAMSVGSLRYRVPTEPELAIIAGAGVVAVGSKVSIVHV